MDRYIYVRELVGQHGMAAWNVLDEFGVALDDWDMRQTLDGLCDDYGLDIGDVMRALTDACDVDFDDDDDDDDGEAVDDIDIDDDWSHADSDDPSIVGQTRRGRSYTG